MTTFKHKKFNNLIIEAFKATYEDIFAGIYPDFIIKALKEGTIKVLDQPRQPLQRLLRFEHSDGKVEYVNEGDYLIKLPEKEELQTESEETFLQIYEPCIEEEEPKQQAISQVKIEPIINKESLNEIGIYNEPTRSNSNRYWCDAIHGYFTLEKSFNIKDILLEVANASFENGVKEGKKLRSQEFKTLLDL